MRFQPYRGRRTQMDPYYSTKTSVYLMCFVFYCCNDTWELFAFTYFPKISPALIWSIMKEKVSKLESIWPLSNNSFPTTFKLWLTFPGVALATLRVNVWTLVSLGWELNHSYRHQQSANAIAVNVAFVSLTEKLLCEKFQLVLRSYCRPKSRLLLAAIENHQLLMLSRGHIFPLNFMEQGFLANACQVLLALVRRSRPVRGDNPWNEKEKEILPKK